jgi:hypothetical protein
MYPDTISSGESRLPKTNRQQLVRTGWVSYGWVMPAATTVLLLGAAAGCQRGPKLVPVSGTVNLQGKPLESGTVMFQPDQGPLARGAIQSDGSFRLTTRVTGDGCVVGPARVRITCFGRPGPGGAATDSTQDEVPAGASLIPKRYTSFGTSGLRVEVRADNEPFVFDLTDEPGAGFRR